MTNLLKLLKNKNGITCDPFWFKYKHALEDLIARLFKIGRARAQVCLSLLARIVQVCRKFATTHISDSIVHSSSSGES